MRSLNMLDGGLFQQALASLLMFAARPTDFQRSCERIGLCPAFNVEPSLEFWRMNRCRHSSVRASIERAYKAWVYKRSSEETPTSTPRYISTLFFENEDRVRN